MARRRYQDEEPTLTGDLAVGVTQPKTAQDVLNDFMQAASRHPDIKLLSTTDGASPRQHELFPDSPTHKQRVMVIKLIHREK